MFYTLLVTVVLLLVCIMAMAFRPLFTKKRKFPNLHIGSNKAMKERGITCVPSQDREAQRKARLEMINKNNNKGDFLKMPQT
ncbi:MAG: hypothetical protein R3Y59_10965 [bacterium]